jgi:hypothetical protein
VEKREDATAKKRFRWASAFCVIALLLYLACGAFSEYWLGTLKSAQWGQDFYIYTEAYHRARSGANPYLPYKIGGSFVYHPFALTIVTPFALASRSSVVPYVAWALLSGAAWVASGLVVLALMGRTLDRTYGLGDAKLRTASLTVLFLGFAPFLEALHVGQVSPFVVLLLCLTIYLCEQEKEIASGLFLALAIVLKTSPLIFLAYFLFMRKLRAIAGTLAGLILVSVIPAVQFSPEVLLDFGRVLPRIASEVHVSPYNQSILGISSQLLRYVSLIRYGGLLVTGQRIAFLGVTALLLVTGLVIPRGAEGLRLRLHLFFCLVALMVLFSPLVWYHHSVLLLLPLAGLFLTRSRLAPAVGLAIIGMIQVNRLFEHTVAFIALPALTAHMVLLGAVIMAYVKEWRASQRAESLLGYRDPCPG